jgi:hypothetical protein
VLVRVEVENLLPIQGSLFSAIVGFSPVTPVPVAFLASEEREHVLEMILCLCPN